MIRVIIAEDHNLVRQGIRVLLEQSPKYKSLRKLLPDMKQYS